MLQSFLGLEITCVPGFIYHADGRTERMVNPRAWDKGMVFVQCGHCNAWHKIRDEAGLVEEIRCV